jgi:hypothetical protein
MPVHTFRPLVALVTAIGILALAAGGAVAASISVSPAGAVTMASLGRVNFSNAGTHCSFSLRGSLQRGPTAEISGTRFGEVTGLSIGSCERGTINGILNMAWSITFNRLTATGLELSINSFSIELRITIIGIPVNCLYGGNLPVLLGISASVTQLITILTNSLALRAGAGSCPASTSLSGTFGLSPTQTVTLA